MSDITIIKKDEVFAKITCEKHVSKELSEFFTFFVPGYQFVPAYRNRVWDGKIRLYNLQTSQVYLGLLPYIEEFCKERNYKFDYGDPRPDIEDECSVYHAKKFIDSLNIHSRGERIEIREHQLDAYIHAMQKRRALLVSPTASGKSLIIYLIFRQLLEFQNLKGLVIVPTTSLVEQLYSDFGDYNDGEMTNIHRIYQGKEKDTDKPLTISTCQSLYKLPKEYFHQFDYIIGDEAHLFKAQSLTTILTSCINAKYRIGLTGTLDGTKTHKLVLEGLFGSVKQVITTR
jgi:superfamily II DNA or RNA helicase